MSTSGSMTTLLYTFVASALFFLRTLQLRGKSEVKRESQISDQPSNNSDARVPVWRVTFMENYVVVRIRPHSQLHLRQGGGGGVRGKVSLGNTSSSLVQVNSIEDRPTEWNF